MNGLFISFEGGEGSGKSSVINVVKEKLESDGYKVVITREPGGVNVSEQIRNVILAVDNQMSKETEALLYAASRVEHLYAKVLPLLAEGYIVLSDRYLDSSLAYQGGARHLGVDEVLAVNSFATENTFPNLTILFDITPELGLERIAKNANREVNRLDLEKLDFHHNVRNTFLSLASKYKDRYVVIDASQSYEAVVNEVYNIIKQRLTNGN